MKPRIYTRISPVNDCGVGYYRMYLPLKTAKEKGELELRCQHFTWGEHNDESGKPLAEPEMKEFKKHADWANLLYWARHDTPDYIAKAGGIREWFYKEKGIYKPIVLDIDDNVQATRPYNPGYRSFHPNSPNMSWNIKSLGIFDAITVSTQNLKDFYSTYTDPSKIFICPNSLDWKERDLIYKNDFKGSKLFPKKEGEIRIGWSGSAAHWENLKRVEKPVLEILRKYPQTTFYFTGLFGDLFKDEELIKAKRIRKVGWAGLRKWAYTNREMNLDIALAPLADNDFNRAKSNLRVLEYASARYPVIASPVEPYKCFKRDEVLFATEEDEWFKAMETLVKSPEKRKALSRNLYKMAKFQYNIDKNYKFWVNTLNKIIKTCQKRFPQTQTPQ